MHRYRFHSRSAIKFLLLADFLIALTVIAFAVAAWISDLPVSPKLLATGFAGTVLAFVIPDAFRELRLLYSPHFSRQRTSADD